jgi:hypothetical protein
MEKLLLTVWGRRRARVSPSRVYELLYAEQLDSVKIGWSRRVSPASALHLAEGPVGVMNSRRPQGKAPTGSPGDVWTDEPPDPTTRP